MSLEHLLEVYGYPVLFGGTLLEGETPLIMAGFLAHRGHLALPLVIVVAFAGTFASDQYFFYMGRTHGRTYLSRRPAWRSKADRALALLERHGLPLVVGFRFLYGLRIATPFAIGMSGFDPLRFFLLNALGGILWSIVIAFLGYSIGGLLSVFLHDLRRYELLVLVAIPVTSAIVWLLYFLFRSRSRREHDGLASG